MIPHSLIVALLENRPFSWWNWRYTEQETKLLNAVLEVYRAEV